MKMFKRALLVAVVGVALLMGFVYSGLYPVAADVPHYQPTTWLLETLRERSIKRAAADISVPKLDSSKLLLSGGADYNDMCAGCHLKPGKDKSDLSIGLYPVPPNLSLPNAHADHDHGHDENYVLQRQFWIIKHGIKASGMPAWGPTHSDERIWAMVAFLRQLPDLTPVQYQILTARQSGADGGHH